MIHFARLVFLLMIAVVSGDFDGFDLSSLVSSKMNLQQLLNGDPNGAMGQQIFDYIIDNSRRAVPPTGNGNTMSVSSANGAGTAAGSGLKITNCGEASRDLACKLYTLATTNVPNANKLVLLPVLTSLLLSGNQQQPSTAVSPLVAIATMCSLGGSDNNVCISEETMRRLLAMANRTDNAVLIVDSFVTARPAGFDLLCRHNKKGSSDDDCMRVARLCAQPGRMTAKLLSATNPATADELQRSPTWQLLDSLAGKFPSALRRLKDSKVKDAKRQSASSLLDSFGLDIVMCRVDPNEPSGKVEPSNPTTELPLPPLPSTTTTTTTTTQRPTQATQPPTTTASVINIGSQTDIASVMSAVNAYYAQVEGELRVIFQQMKQRRPGAPMVSSTMQRHQWETPISVPVSGYEQQVRQVMYRAAKNRLILRFQSPPTTNPNRPRDERSGATFDWESSARSWLEGLPALISGIVNNNAQTRVRRQTYYNQCSTDTMRAACQLLDMNNNGTVFLLPWVLEDLFSGTRTTTTGQASTALASAIALCSGQKATTYYGTKVCPSQSMLSAAGQTALATYRSFATPTYVASFMGGPSYVTMRKPSSGHFLGQAVDFLCGSYVYNPPAADDSCKRLSQNCFQTFFRTAYFPAQDPAMGCGDTNTLPITATHCAN